MKPKGAKMKKAHSLSAERLTIPVIISCQAHGCVTPVERWYRTSVRKYCSPCMKKRRNAKKVAAYHADIETARAKCRAYKRKQQAPKESNLVYVTEDELRLTLDKFVERGTSPTAIERQMGLKPGYLLGAQARAYMFGGARMKKDVWNEVKKRVEIE